MIEKYIIRYNKKFYFPKWKIVSKEIGEEVLDYISQINWEDSNSSKISFLNTDSGDRDVWTDYQSEQELKNDLLIHKLTDDEFNLLTKFVGDESEGNLKFIIHLKNENILFDSLTLSNE